MTAFRVGIGGPVGSGKTSLIERLVPLLIDRGRTVSVVTNDIVTREDELHVRAALDGVLEGGRIVGVETGTCPHNAVREDPSMNLAVLDELEAAYPGTDYVLLESGGDNLTLTFSPELVDYSVYVIDVAGGDKIPRKRGQGLVQADLLVINKTDLASFVGADLGVMERDSRLVRGSGPFLFTDCRSSEGIDAVIEELEGARATNAEPRRGAAIAGAALGNVASGPVTAGQEPAVRVTAGVQAPHRHDGGAAHRHDGGAPHRHDDGPARVHREAGLP